jgi:hypothetical protein
MTLNAIFQSRGFDAAQISQIQVEGVYTPFLSSNHYPVYEFMFVFSTKDDRPYIQNKVDGKNT